MPCTCAVSQTAAGLTSSSALLSVVNSDEFLGSPNVRELGPNGCPLIVTSHGSDCRQHTGLNHCMLCRIQQCIRRRPSTTHCQGNFERRQAHSKFA